jgi:hypothetical protein
MDVFERRIVGHALDFVPFCYPIQAGKDCARGTFVNNRPRAQHRGMRAAAGDVLPPHPLVDRQARVYLAHHRGGAFGEPPAPHWVGARHVVTLGRRPDPHAAGRLR